MDDRELPLPYVIDPAVSHDATTVSNNGAAGAANITLTYPAGVSQFDLLVATIAVRGGVAVTTPGGWAAGRSSQNGVNVRLATFYKVATAGEPASPSFALASSQQAVGAISAYYGIKASLGNANILDVMGAAATANSNTATASTITTTTANALIVASFGTNNTDTFGAVTGMTERWDATSGSAAPDNRASCAQQRLDPARGRRSGAKTSALSANRQWAAHLHSFEVDNVNPTRHADDSVSHPRNLHPHLDRFGRRLGGHVGALRGLARGRRGVDDARHELELTVVVAVRHHLSGDGFYDVRITVTDWAGNTATATASTIRVDNSSADQNPLTLTPLTGITNSTGTRRTASTTTTRPPPARSRSRACRATSRPRSRSSAATAAPTTTAP